MKFVLQMNDWFVSGSPGLRGIPGTFDYSMELNRARVYATVEAAVEAVRVRNQYKYLLPPGGQNADFSIVPVVRGTIERLI